MSQRRGWLGGCWLALCVLTLGSSGWAEQGESSEQSKAGEHPQPKLPPELAPKPASAAAGENSRKPRESDNEGDPKQDQAADRKGASQDGAETPGAPTEDTDRAGVDGDAPDGVGSDDDSEESSVPAPVAGAESTISSDPDADVAADSKQPRAVAPSQLAQPTQQGGQRPIASYGPISVGHPHAGFLVNGVQMPTNPHWVLTVPAHGFGTQEMVDALSHCIESVSARLPNTPPVMLGSISAKDGGHLPPHLSHRTGRDADVYFFRTPGAKWVEAAKQDDIDYPRTWLLLRCFVTDVDTDFILIDKKVQGWLEAFALGIGEDPEWIDRIFHDKAPYHRSVIRHVPGHVAHMHVRVVSPEARRRGVALYDRLVQGGRVKNAYRRAQYQVKRGDTLIGIAKAQGTSVKALRAANGIKGSLIRAGQRLNIDRPVEIRDARAPIIVPPRQLPKPRDAQTDTGAGEDSDSFSSNSPKTQPLNASPATPSPTIRRSANPRGRSGAFSAQLGTLR